MRHRDGLLWATGFGLLLPVFAFACSSDDAPGAATSAEPECPGNLPAFRFPHGSDGHGDPFSAKAANAARAGRIHDASQIVQPADARNKVRTGDFLLANDKIAVYVEAEGESDGYNPLGGDILALETIGADGRAMGVSRYNETLVMLARQTVQPDKVSVVADGSDGKAAVVRVSGKLANVPFLDTFRAIIPDEYGFPAALDYVLEPGSPQLLLRLSLVNTKTEPVDFDGKQFLGFFQSNRHQLFTEALGFADPRGQSPWVGFESDTSSFLARAVNSPIQAEIGISGFQMFSFKGLALDACATKTVDYASLLVTSTGIDGLLESKRASVADAPWREVRGTLSEANGAGLAGALIHATTTDARYLTRTRTDASGSFVLHVPPGAPALLTPTLKGWATPAPVTVGADAPAVSLTLPKRATLSIDVKDTATKQALPARVQVIPQAALAPAPASFGLTDSEARGRLWNDFAIDGHLDLPVPEGEHRVVVTRGYEYELYDAPATAKTGTTTSIPVSLTHSVDSTGVMCADFHIHSHYSSDSNDAPELKVRGAIADGLEIPVSSEHEWIIDFQPIIARLGLTQWAYGFPSEELTTFSWGHFGVIPLFPKSEAVNNGAIGWVGKKPPEFFQTVLALPERPVLVVNHPSTSGFLGYFSAAGFDRTTAKGDPELWSDAFSALEVFNESDFDANRGNSVADWFALLNAGKTYWTTGSSDSHHERTTPVGYPRTCLSFGHDDPTKLSAEIVRDVLRTGAATISGGLLMNVTGPSGVGPGGTTTKGAYRVVVQSPGWLTASTLEIIVDGVSVETRPLTESVGAGPAHRYETTVDVAPTQSKARHWVVFHAKSAAADLAPLHPGKKAFAVSNPIFFGP